MGKNKKLFSKQVEEKHIIYRFLGLKLAVKNPDYVNLMELETKNAIKIQDAYDLSALKSAQKLILFLTPARTKVCGGVMSIYSLCETSRMLNPNSVCIISTLPNDLYTYASNDKFLNNEQIYRFSQVVDNCKAIDELIIHVPDYYTKNFYSDLKKRDIKFLKSIKNLHINILNQNIDIMPEPDEIKDLYKLTNNITQTIAHDRYATQEVCNKWQIPTHLFSVHIPLEKYKSYKFENKEKIIAYSPDKNDISEDVIELLKQEMPDFKLVKIENMSFSEYMDTIAKSFFTITFGEGFDGYLIQPEFVGSIGIATYNNRFFPDESWTELKNIFKSDNDMLSNLINTLKELYNNQELYYDTITKFVTKLSTIYVKDNYTDNLERFYKNEYDFYPKRNNEEEKQGVTV